ncbi:MAG: Zeta toxin family protein [Candidatus Thiodiazotropha sp. (ex Dulcina madagascariensis)]|nr:Zeta toxin family protein [Candidatus Thiodiazotropha sp. (ex Dulcina madagascariensis)]
MTGAASPRILIIAGPNGAGKTTFANEFLPKEANCPQFINADLIAAGLSPFQPEAAAFRAGRLVLEQIAAFVHQRQSFAFETTLSGRGYARLIPEWRDRGYFVELFFLRLPDADFAVSRVRQRVTEGGHNLPEPVIRRRFETGWRHFETLYRSLVNAWAIYDNAGVTPVLLSKGVNP